MFRGYHGPLGERLHIGRRSRILPAYYGESSLGRYFACRCGWIYRSIVLGHPECTARYVTPT